MCQTPSNIGHEHLPHRVGPASLKCNSPEMYFFLFLKLICLVINNNLNQHESLLLPDINHRKQFLLSLYHIRSKNNGVRDGSEMNFHLLRNKYVFTFHVSKTLYGI